jgi:hypothetical protein
MAVDFTLELADEISEHVHDQLVEVAGSHPEGSPKWTAFMAAAVIASAQVTVKACQILPD